MIETLKQTAKKVLDALQNEGAEQSETTVTYTVTHEFNVDGGAFSLFRTLFDKKLTMSGITAGKRGTVSQNRWDDATVAESAKACMDAANASMPDDAWQIAPLTKNEDFTLGEVRPDLDRLFMRCRELMDTIRDRFPKIIMEQMIVSHRERFEVKANSNGVLFSTHGGSYEAMLMYSAHEGEKASSFFGGGVITDNLDKPFIACGSIETDLENVEKQIETESVEGKFEGTMVLMPGCAGELIGGMLMNFAGEQGLLSGTSPWKEKLGEPIADERLSVSIAPLDERIVCGERYTDEGFPAKNYDIIRNGRLEAFALGLYASNKLGLARAENDSYNMIVAPGDKPLSEIIASIDRGILVGRFSGGQPASNGDFSGVAKNSFLIENGRIGSALAETMISGNLAEMLRRVRAISKETVAEGMTVLPYLAFDGITVSGK